MEKTGSRRTESQTPASHLPVAILGAGLTGMSAALSLRSAGVPFRIFEKQPFAGGHAITIEDSGYRFDRTGHLLHLRDPAMRKRVLEWIGPDHLQIQRRSVIWSNGVYTRYPFQANTYGLPPDVAYECVMGFVQAHFAEKTVDPQNFEEFCLAHFGPGISRHFMIPYNSRLWGVHPREITSTWCQRFVPLPKLEDVLAGAVGQNNRELGYNANFVYPRLGIGELPKAMERELGTIEFARAPVAIDFARKRLHFEHEVISYDVLISTAPLSRLLQLFQAGSVTKPPQSVVDKAQKLRCTHLYYLDVALDTPCQKDVHWVYVPEQRYPFYRVGCYSHFSPAMAPPGKANLYVELAERNPPNLDQLLPRVAEGLREMGLIEKPGDIAFARLRRIDHAYVIFDHEYFGALEIIKPFLQENAILSAGRYGDWNYSSMEDALLFGESAARSATDQLF